MSVHLKRDMENLKNGVKNGAKEAFNDVALATPVSVMRFVVPLTIITIAGLSVLFSGCTDPNGIDTIDTTGFSELEIKFEGLTGVEDVDPKFLAEASGFGTSAVDSMLPEDEMKKVVNIIAEAVQTAEEEGQNTGMTSLELSTWSTSGEKLDGVVNVQIRGGVPAVQQFDAIMATYGRELATFQNSAELTESMATATATATVTPTATATAYVGATPIPIDGTTAQANEITEYFNLAAETAVKGERDIGITATVYENGAEAGKGVLTVDGTDITVKESLKKLAVDYKNLISSFG